MNLLGMKIRFKLPWRRAYRRQDKQSFARSNLAAKDNATEVGLGPQNDTSQVQPNERPDPIFSRTESIGVVTREEDTDAIRLSFSGLEFSGDTGHLTTTSCNAAGNQPAENEDSDDLQLATSPISTTSEGVVNEEVTIATNGPGLESPGSTETAAVNGSAGLGTSSTPETEEILQDAPTPHIAANHPLATSPITTEGNNNDPESTITHTHTEGRALLAPTFNCLESIRGLVLISGVVVVDLEEDESQSADNSGESLDVMENSGLFANAHQFVTDGVESITQQNKGYHSSSSEDLLNDIPNPVGTSWDPVRTCLHGTRANIIQDAIAWLSDFSTSETAEIFLVADAAGTGKTTLAHTIAEEARRADSLVTSFFFSQLNGGYSTTRYLLGALIRGLCYTNSQAMNVAAQLLGADSSLATAPPIRQFRDLIVPVCDVFPRDQPLAIVLDALDEGFDTDLLKILRDYIPRLPSNFRIFLTCRPEERIMDQLESRPHIHCCSHPLSGAGSLGDVEKYIDMKFQDCEVLSSAQHLKEDFVHRSGGVFLWTVIVLNHVKQAFDPVTALEQVLREDGGYWVSDEDAEQRLDTLYDRLLLTLEDDVAFVVDYQKVVGALVTLKEPVSADTLSRLYVPEGVSAASIIKIASCIRPLLDGFDPDSPHEPIQFLHQSIREYLVGRAPPLFRIDTTKHHPVLCCASLTVIDQELHSDKLPFLGYTQYQKGNPVDTSSIHQTSPQLQYSCKFLFDHALDTTPSEFDRAYTPTLTRVLSLRGTELLEITAAMGTTIDLGRFKCWASDVFHTLKMPLEDGDWKNDLKIAASLERVACWLILRRRYGEARVSLQSAIRIIRYLMGIHHGRPTDLIPPTDLVDLTRLLARVISLASKAHAGDFAVGYCQEAIGLYRHLLALQPTSSGLQYELSRSLTHFAMLLMAKGEPSDRPAMIDALKEAVDLCKFASMDDFILYGVPLAISHLNLSFFLLLDDSEEGRDRVGEEAEKAALACETLTSGEDGTKDLLLAFSCLASCLANLEERSVAGEKAAEYIRALCTVTAYLEGEVKTIH